MKTNTDTLWFVLRGGGGFNLFVVTFVRGLIANKGVVEFAQKFVSLELFVGRLGHKTILSVAGKRLFPSFQ